MPLPASVPSEGDPVQKMMSQIVGPPGGPIPSAPSKEQVEGESEFGHMPVGNRYRSVSNPPPPTNPTAEGTSHVANAVLGLGPQIEGQSSAETPPGEIPPEEGFESKSIDEIVPTPTPEVPANPSPAHAVAKETQNALQARNLPPEPSAPPAPANGSDVMVTNLSTPAAQTLERRANGHHPEPAPPVAPEEAAQTSTLAKAWSKVKNMPIASAPGVVLASLSEIADIASVKAAAAAIRNEINKILWIDVNSNEQLDHRTVNPHNRNVVGILPGSNQVIGHIDAVRKMKDQGSPHIQNPHQTRYIGIHSHVFAAFAEQVSKHIDEHIKNETSKHEKRDTDVDKRSHEHKAKQHAASREIDDVEKESESTISKLPIKQLEESLLNSLAKLDVIQKALQKSREAEKERISDERKSRELQKELNREELKRELLKQELLANEIVKRSKESSEGIPPNLKPLVDIILARKAHAA